MKVWTLSYYQMNDEHLWAHVSRVFTTAQAHDAARREADDTMGIVDIRCGVAHVE